MRVIPAIDLKDGQCVRLQKGDYGTAHKVAENPVETAQRFLDAGADLVHMVDLDAAKDGSHANYGVVEQVIRETGATVELGGGIRSMQDVETVLALGVSRVIIGSAAVRDPEFVAEAVKKVRRKIVVGIDAKSETVRTDGWLGDSGENYIAFAERMESIGVRHIIFTDIDKDGMLAGPNFDQLAALRASVSCEIIASGGVSSLARSISSGPGLGKVPIGQKSRDLGRHYARPGPMGPEPWQLRWEGPAKAPSEFRQKGGQLREQAK